MTFFPWDDEYLVGVPQFDEDHRRIVAMLNRLYAAMTTGDVREAIRATLDELLDYTATHFAAEEKFMEETGFPFLAEHAAEHRKLVAGVRELRERFDASDVYLRLTMDIYTFLKEWLDTHIRVSDRQYGLHVRLHRGETPPAGEPGSSP